MQWRYPLVGAHEPAKYFRIEPAVGVGNECPGQPEHSGVALEVTLHQFGQLSIKARRQIITDLPQLFVYDMVVVDQPFCGRFNRASLPNFRGNGAIRFAQHASVVRSEEHTSEL